MRLPSMPLRTRLLAAVIAIITILSCMTWSPVSAVAAPPTVQPSPGYDARLAERRAAMSAAQAPAPIQKSPMRRPLKRLHRTH
ncbi:hypothetical protein V1281_004885 [Nitrobacteraceae bacterium AZCC 2161]